jgi:two-component system OmpR family sensor kinase
MTPMITWTRLPLRTQLTALFTALLLVGLTLTGVAALSLLRRSLVAELDAQLATSARALATHALLTGGEPREEADERVLPSDYQAVFLDVDGNAVQRYSTADDAAAPDVPALTSDEVVALDGAPFTVGSTAGSARWRVVALPAVARATGAVVGSVAVALPLSAAEATLAAMRLALVVIGVTVVGVGALAGRWGVRRSLRPLRQIEDTAAAIAAGDLTRRVPDAPAGTEVGRLSAALNTMLSQIEQAFAVRAASEERMRRFVADASHELRTPLATIRGYGELYRMGALTDPEDLPRTMRRIEDSATRMGTLVQDLLHLARLGEGRPLAQDDVDLSVLVADAGADLRALDPTRPVRLVPLTDGGTTAGAITVGDESRLRQVLANLVGNVVQHTPAASPVELAVGREDGSAVLEVRDHGPGISPEHASRVFERFYRVDQARGRDSGGAGLGMAIVAAIVGAHQGHVQLGPTPGGGTTIRIALPAAPAPAPA